MNKLSFQLQPGQIKKDSDISAVKKWCLILLPVAVFLLSFCCGRYSIAPGTVISVLKTNFLELFNISSSANFNDFEESVVLSIRMPRIILGMLVGAGLSVAGAALQGLFGNPLVSPQVLGVSSGSGFGAALAILLFGNAFSVQALSVITGLVAVGMTYSISRIRGGQSSIFMLVLAGTITAAFFEALISAAKLVADPFSKLPAITYWLMGSLANVSYKNVLSALPLITIGMAVLFLYRWRINVLSLDKDEAKALGVNLQRSRIIVILACSIITAASVSVCGIIGWIGLVIPHICRTIVGPNHKNLIPACMSVGGVYLVIIDNIARSATSTEIPLSILTAVVGAPFFAYLLKRSGGQWT